MLTLPYVLDCFAESDSGSGMNKGLTDGQISESKDRA